MSPADAAHTGAQTRPRRQTLAAGEEVDQPAAVRDARRC